MRRVRRLPGRHAADAEHPARAAAASCRSHNPTPHSGHVQRCTHRQLGPWPPTCNKRGPSGDWHPMSKMPPSNANARFLALAVSCNHNPHRPERNTPHARAFTSSGDTRHGRGLLLAPAVALAHPSPLSHPSRSSGYVYVNDNSATNNAVAGFRRHPDGSLTPAAPVAVHHRRCRNRNRDWLAGLLADPRSELRARGRRPLEPDLRARRARRRLAAPGSRRDCRRDRAREHRRARQRRCTSPMVRREQLHGLRAGRDRISPSARSTVRIPR